VAAAVALAALLVFVPALHGGFVYDDHRFYAENESLGTPSILWRAFADPACQTSDGTHAGLWRPLRTLSFALDRAVFGDAAAGPHAVNVLLHAGGAAVLSLLLLAWELPPLAAALGAAAYAVHPAQTEVVAWISSRGDLLAVAGVLGALLADLRGRSRLAAALGVAALLSKEQAVVWPALVVLSRLVARRGAAESFRAARIPLAATAAFVLVRHLLLREPFQEGGLGQGRVPFVMLAAMLGHQAWFTLLPVGSIFDWQMPWVERPPGAVTLVAFAVLGGLFVRGFRVPAAWFLAALVPTWLLQAFVPLNILVADRFLLFALPAGALLLARAAARGPVLASGAAATVLAFGALTWDLVPVWRSDTTLWTRTAERVPGHPRASHWRGVQALREGRADEALPHLLVAAMANTADAMARYHLAYALEQIAIRTDERTRFAQALDNYRAAIDAFGRPRAEGAGDFLPLARLADVDLTLELGDRERGRSALEDLLSRPAPRISAANEKAWRIRIDLLTDTVTARLDGDLARRLRSWGGAR